MSSDPAWSAVPGRTDVNWAFGGVVSTSSTHDGASPEVGGGSPSPMPLVTTTVSPNTPSPGRSNSTGDLRSGSSQSRCQVLPWSPVIHTSTLLTPLGPTWSSRYSSVACVPLRSRAAVIPDWSAAGAGTANAGLPGAAGAGTVTWLVEGPATGVSRPLFSPGDGSR